MEEINGLVRQLALRFDGGRLVYSDNAFLALQFVFPSEFIAAVQLLVDLRVELFVVGSELRADQSELRAQQSELRGGAELHTLLAENHGLLLVDGVLVDYLHWYCQCFRDSRAYQACEVAADGGSTIGSGDLGYREGLSQFRTSPQQLDLPVCEHLLCANLIRNNAGLRLRNCLKRVDSEKDWLDLHRDVVLRT